MPFDQFVQNRILAPLRMNDTHFQVPKEKVTRLAKTYTIREGRLVENPPNDSMGEINPEVPYGGMSLYSTIGDYARFGQMLLNGGQLDGVRLLGRKTVELMTVNHLNNLAVPYSDKNGAYGFGLGGTVRVDVAKGNAPGSLGQFGWDGSATTYFRMDPNERTISLLSIGTGEPTGGPGCAARHAGGKRSDVPRHRRQFLVDCCCTPPGGAEVRELPGGAFVD